MSGSLSRLKLFLFASLLAFGSLHSFGQNHVIDSLRNELNHKLHDTIRADVLNLLCYEHITLDLQQSISYGTNAYNLSSRIQYEQGICSSLRYMGMAHNHFGSPKEAENLLLKSLDYTDDPYILAQNYNELGIVNKKQGNLDVALEYYLKSMDLLKGLNKKNHYYSLHTNLGYFYLQLGQLDEGITMCATALAYFSSINKKNSAANSCSCLGNAFAAKGDLDSSQFYFKASYDFFHESGGSLLNEVQAELNLAAIYTMNGLYNESIFYTRQSIEKLDSLGLSSYLSMAYLTLGENYMKLGFSDSVEKYFDLSASELDDSHAIEETYNTYLSISELYNDIGNFEKALEYRIRYHELRDSVLQKGVQLEIEEIESKYELSQKEQEISELEYKNEIETERSRKKTYQTILLSLAIVLIVGIFIVLFRVNKRKAQQKRTQLENIALKSQMNPHFIFNCLNSIQEMYMSGETEGANEFIGNFSRVIRKVLDNSSLQEISLLEELELLELYVKLEMERVEQFVRYDISVDDEIDRLNTMVSPLIIQPIVENAIWHGISPLKEEGVLKIKISKGAGSTIICEVSDNGIGFKKIDTTRSKGLTLTEARLNSDIEIVPLEKGTRVKMIIPIQYKS